MKKAVISLFALLSVGSSYALGTGWHATKLQRWGVGTSSNTTGLGFSITVSDEPSTWIAVDNQLQDTIEKEKLLAAVLTSVKSMGGKIYLEIGSSGKVVNIFDDN